MYEMWFYAGGGQQKPLFLYSYNQSSSTNSSYQICYKKVPLVNSCILKKKTKLVLSNQSDGSIWKKKKKTSKLWRIPLKIIKLYKYIKAFPWRAHFNSNNKVKIRIKAIEKSL